MLQSEIEEEITKKNQNNNVDQLEKQTAHPDTGKDMDALYRRGIKSLQHKLLPECKKSEGDSK